MIAGGIDWGRHSDYTSAVRLVFRPNRLIIDRFFRMKNESWDTIVAHVNRIIAGSSRTLSDGTGVGDALTSRVPNAISVVLTGAGGRKLPGNRISVGTVQLFKPLVNAINSGELQCICPAPILEKELKDFVVSYTRKGKPQFAARQGNDDTVFALALAIYAVKGDLYVKSRAAA